MIGVKNEYLLVITFRGQDKAYFFEDELSLLEFQNCSSIEEIINKSNYIQSYAVFEINRKWLNDYE